MYHAFYLTHSTDTVGTEVSHMVTKLDTRATVWLRAEVSAAACVPQHTARNCLMCLTLSRPRETRDARLGLRQESTSPKLPPFPAAHRGILKCSGVAASPYAVFWRRSPRSCVASVYEGTGSQVWWGGSEFNQRRLKFAHTFWATSHLFSNGLSPATFQVVARASMASVWRNMMLCIVTNKEGFMTLTCFALYLFLDHVL